MLSTDACVRFRDGGVIRIDASLNVSARTHIQCCTYPDGPPILAIQDAHVSVSLTVPDRHQVTPGDLEVARRLADEVAAYIAELEHRMATQGPAAEGEAA